MSLLYLGVDFLFDCFHFSHHYCIDWWDERKKRNCFPNYTPRHFFFFCHSFVWLNKFIDVDCLLWYSKYSAAQSTFDAMATTKKVYTIEMLYQHRLYTIRAKISTNWKFSQWIYKSSYCVRRLCMDWWYWLVGLLSFFSISCGFGIKIVI